MRTVKVSGAPINTTPKDWEGNTAKILQAITWARDVGVSVLCLPEMCITGYGCEDEFHASYVHEWALRILNDRIRPATQGIFVAVGLPFHYGGGVYNAVAAVYNQRILGIVCKQNLAGDGIHYEPRFFKPWPLGEKVDAIIGDDTVPVGDLLFDVHGVRIGFEICEDAWVAARPGIRLARQACDLILNPSASHFSFGKTSIRHAFVREGSRAFHSVYVYCNLVGNEAGRAIYSGDCVIATEGKIVGKTPLFSYDDFVPVSAVVDIDRNRVERSRQSAFTPSLKEDIFIVRSTEGTGLESSEAYPIAEYSGQHESLGQGEGFLSWQEELIEAVGMGLFDYMRKSWTRGFAISLSGGADSAACLVLVYMMVVRVRERRPDHPYFLRLLDGQRMDAMSPQDIMKRLCVTVYQKAGGSTSGTENAARALAAGVGARFSVIDVSPLVSHYEGILSDFLGRELSWEQDDIPRQNLQARVRAPSIWSLANACNYLLLSTSNRSEAAVGYCTMDGDTAGCLSPIAGIGKQMLREWLHWVEKTYVPSLKQVNEQTPSAELRPTDSNQTDEEDLMPYDVLNVIQKLAVVKKESPRDIYLTLSSSRLRSMKTVPEPQQWFDWIRRYFTLWSRNQWKRERYAPAFHLDDENLDPRSWCRYPILSGGYVKELKELASEFNLKY